MMIRKEKWLRRLARRLRVGLFLRLFVDWAVVFCLAVGALFVGLKIIWPGAWPSAAYLLLLLVPMVAVAWWTAGQRMYSRTQTVAMLDRRIGAGGLLMTLMEQPQEVWENRLPESEKTWQRGIPPIRPVRLLKYLSIPLLFLCMSIWLPPRMAQALRPQPSAISKLQAEQLEQMLAQLKEVAAVEPERSEALQEEIERLKQQTELTPLTHEDWAAFDAAREELELAAMSRQNKLSQAASNIASALDQLNHGGNLSESDRAELQSMVDSLCESGNSGGEGKGATGKSGKGGKSSKFAGQMNGWAEGNPLEKDGEALAKALEELSDLIACECEGLAGMCDKMGMCEGLCDGGQKPGRGGVNRGRGDAELSFGEESSEQGAKFRDVAMPQGIADENGQLIETTFSVPEVNPVAPSGRSTARAAADATGDQTWKQPVRPRHREALKRYFGGSPAN